MALVRLDALQLSADDLIIEQQAIQVKSRPDYTNKWRKLLFFLWREGVTQTVRKIKSKKVDKRFGNTTYLTLIKLRHKDGVLINLSTQYTKNPAYFVIPNRFLLSDKADISIKAFSPSDFNQFAFSETDPERQNDRNTPTAAVASFPEKEVELPVIPSQAKGIFLYGLGDYARVYIAPHLAGFPKMACVDYHPGLTAYFKHTFGFSYGCTLAKDSYAFLAQTASPLAIIATYHSDHSRLAWEIFQKNPATLIFIEKPPCVTLEDLRLLIALYNAQAKLEIGFNRRYIPFNRTLKDRLSGKPFVATISVKEILLNESHWYFWENQGTRITGNLVHWIDLSHYWAQAKPVALTLSVSAKVNETMTLGIIYENGTLTSITVSDLGNSLRGVQEKIEVRTEEETFFIDDDVLFSTTHKNGKKTTRRCRYRKKGHQAMYNTLLETYRNGTTGTYPVTDLIYTSVVTYYASVMFRTRTPYMEIGGEVERFLEVLREEPGPDR